MGESEYETSSMLTKVATIISIAQSVKLHPSYEGLPITLFVLLTSMWSRYGNVRCFIAINCK